MPKPKEMAYNNVFRRLMGYDKYCSGSGMFVENRTDGFDALVRKLVYGFRERLDISDNSLIETVINSSAWRSSKLSLRWRHNDLNWHLKSPASRLFTQPFIQTQIKVNIKAPRHWPLCGEFTGTGDFPAQRSSYAENVSIWWRHHGCSCGRIICIGHKPFC